MPNKISKVSSIAISMLQQKLSLLNIISPKQYTQPISIASGATIGQHLRHSINHFESLIETYQAKEDCINDSFKKKGNIGIVIQYDKRKRKGQLENDPNFAIKKVQELIEKIEGISRKSKEIEKAEETEIIHVAFIITSDGQEQSFETTFARELGFVVHHAIHHHAIIKMISNCSSLQPPLNLDSLDNGFGVAPSTLDYQTNNNSSDKR